MTSWFTITALTLLSLVQSQATFAASTFSLPLRPRFTPTQQAVLRPIAERVQLGACARFYKDLAYAYRDGDVSPDATGPILVGNPNLGVSSNYCRYADASYRDDLYALAKECRPQGTVERTIDGTQCENPLADDALHGGSVIFVKSSDSARQTLEELPDMSRDVVCLSEGIHQSIGEDFSDNLLFQKQRVCEAAAAEVR